VVSDTLNAYPQFACSTREAAREVAWRGAKPGSSVQSEIKGGVELGGKIRCSECRRSVDEFTAMAERWGFWSDGCGELLRFCPDCATREFPPDASAGGHASRPEHTRES